MSDKVLIKLYINTGYPSASHSAHEEVDREEWEAMTEREKDEFLEDAAQTFMQNKIDFGAYVEEEN